MVHTFSPSTWEAEEGKFEVSVVYGVDLCLKQKKKVSWVFCAYLGLPPGGLAKPLCILFIICDQEVIKDGSRSHLWMEMGPH